MSPQTQLRWTIIAALLMWAPAGIAMAAGRTDFMRGGLLFVGALIFSYIGLTVIAHLVNNYQRTQHMVARAQQQIEYLERKKAEEEEAEAQKRRNGDQ